MKGKALIERLRSAPLCAVERSSKGERSFYKIDGALRIALLNELQAAELRGFQRGLEEAAGIAENWNGSTSDGNTFFIAKAIRTAAQKDTRIDG